MTIPRPESRYLNLVRTRKNHDFELGVPIEPALDGGISGLQRTTKFVFREFLCIPKAVPNSYYQLRGGSEIQLLKQPRSLIYNRVQQ